MTVFRTKKPTRARTLKSANSPEPPTMDMREEAMCGHSGCGRECNVHYVGPVSHISHHHALHAARGIAHIWTATIVTGLAIVLTGAVALTAAQASTTKPSPTDKSAEIQRLSAKIDELQKLVESLREQCRQNVKQDETTPTSTMPDTSKPKKGTGTKSDGSTATGSGTSTTGTESGDSTTAPKKTTTSGS